MTQRQRFVKMPEILNYPPMATDFSRKKGAFASKVIDSSKNTRFCPCLLNSRLPWIRPNWREEVRGPFFQVCTILTSTPKILRKTLPFRLALFVMFLLFALRLVNKSFGLYRVFLYTISRREISIKLLIANFWLNRNHKTKLFNASADVSFRFCIMHSNQFLYDSQPPAKIWLTCLKSTFLYETAHVITLPLRAQVITLVGDKVTTRTCKTDLAWSFFQVLFTLCCV